MKLIKLNTSKSNPFNDAKTIELEKELLNHCEIQGRQNGLQNKPITEEEFRAYILNHIETKIQATLNENEQEHLPISGMVVAQKIQADAKEEINKLNAILADDEHKLWPLEERKKEKAPDLAKRRIRRWINTATGVIAVADGVFVYEAARAMPLPKIPALIIATAIAFAIGFGVHILAGFILKAKTKIQIAFRYCLVLIPAFIGFYVIGHIRAKAYNGIIDLNNQIAGGSEQITTSVSGLDITIISFLLFLAALLFSMRYYKSKEERLQEQEYDRICREIKDLKDKMEATRRKIKDIREEANQKSAEALARYEYALATERCLISLARKAMEVYKDSNLRYRTDGICPVFFSHPPPFNFQTFFNNNKAA